MKYMWIWVICLLSSSLILAADKTTQIDNLLQSYANDEQFSGSILVAEKGQVIYKKSFGYANLEWMIHNNVDTKFRLASVTKQFTATLIMQLVEEGKLDLNGKLSAYLPYYRKDTGDRITIHQLLNHTSGIPSFTNSQLYQTLKLQAIKPDSMVIKYASGDLEFEPGTETRYNNSAFFILGVIIEKLRGKPYEQVLREYIFDPLQMNDSGYDKHAQIISKRASGYDMNYAGYENAPFIDMSVPFSAGALYSTVEDLHRWDRGLYSGKIISAASLEKMFSPSQGGYGYGWAVLYLPTGPSDSTRAVAHSGGIEGFNTRIMRILDDQYVVIALCNTPGVSLGLLFSKIGRLLYDQPYEPPQKLADKEIIAILLKNGIARAEERFAEISKSSDTGYEFNSGRFNRLGYALLADGKNAEAISVFKMNVKQFPASANAHDSLAEAYMISGDKTQAIKYYQMALEKLDQDTSIQESLKQRLRNGATENLKKLSE